jgi:hypothetical protein
VRSLKGDACIRGRREQGEIPAKTREQQLANDVCVRGLANTCHLARARGNSIG